MIHIFDINTIMFTIWGYPMSYLEFFGTILNIASVWLVAKRNIWNWGIGILGVILFLILFYQINLYADFFEQVYYLITGFWGWWVWHQDAKNKISSEKYIWSSKIESVISWTSIAIGSLAGGYLMAHVHILLPAFFPEAASLPYLDTFTTVLSFAATILMVHKKIDSWIMWIIVDVIGIGLYYVKGVKLISLLYCVFLVLAIKGLRDWYNVWKRAQKNIG